MACWPRRRTFDNFRAVPGTEDALSAAKAFAEGESAPWLVLVGRFGSGKTHLAKAVMLRLMERLHLEIPVLSAIRLYYLPRLLEEIKAGFDDGTHREVEADVRVAKYLLVDDLGDAGRADSQRDMTATGTTPWAREEVTKLLSERYEDELPTMVTTNHTRREIEALYGPRLASRLFGEATGQVRVEAITAFDYRKGG